MQLALGAGRERRDFPVRVKSGQRGPWTDDVADALHFLFDALLENHLAADAANEQSQIGRYRTDRFIALFSGSNRAVDQTVKTDLAAKAKASNYVLVSLYPDNPTPIVVTAWARQLRMATYDSALVNKFIDVYGVKGPTVPEIGSPCRGGIGVPPDRPVGT